MAIGNEQVTVAICDACGKRTYGDPGEQPAVLTGRVDDYTGDVIQNIEWSACGAGHVGGAVKAVIKDARDKRKRGMGQFTSRPAAPTTSAPTIPASGNGVPHKVGASS